MGWWEDLQEGAGNFWEDITGQTAANQATSAVREGTNLSVEEQRRQFDTMQEMLAPYMQAGENSVQEQQALSGALGPQAQQDAIDQIMNSPGFQASLQSGENAILQNASATGGLRGGNTQGALGQFAPQMLGQAVNQRFGQLGGLTQTGVGAASGVGSAGLQTGQGIAGAYGQMGQANAANALAGYTLPYNFIKDIAGFGLNVAQGQGGGL